ncbi:28S ribosomal protein S5, mitochondrial isoform X3 [Nematostella vectensis]|uniref:28S ribosomal protein S5, mitochondrial isoform X3 n=1 Tax=Nematostella vectensis TaxID=45351 RepID=UPI002076E811|nr:28S ribosomal protein S5, mitochondrial isoform X3 [Nematostella vectensis]
MAAAYMLLRRACSSSGFRLISPLYAAQASAKASSLAPSFTVLSSLTRAIAIRGSVAGPQLNIQRNLASNKEEYDKLWAAATGGRGTGRGRKKKVKKGVDPEKLKFARGGTQWEGFNAPVILEGDVVEKGRLPGKEDDQEFRRPGQWFERGWSGTTWPGRKAGNPQRSDREVLKNFDSVVVELRRVSNVTSGGKKRSLRALVVVGNRNGAAGFGVGKGRTPISAIRKARNKAVNYLYFVERCDNRTIFHDFETQFKKTKIIFQRFGLSCHRAIKEIAELLGIDDMRCKVLGPTTPLSLVQAVFQGLTSQETHQELADRTGLHVVELREEYGRRPIVVASPSDKASREALRKRIHLDDYDLDKIFDPHKGLHRPKKRSELF